MVGVVGMLGALGLVGMLGLPAALLPTAAPPEPALAPVMPLVPAPAFASAPPPAPLAAPWAGTPAAGLAPLPPCAAGWVVPAWVAGVLVPAPAIELPADDPLEEPFWLQLV